jgi:endonuclease III
MNNANKDISTILEKLEEMYPYAHCELNFNSNFELLVAVILSAQCTDKRVNIVAHELFKKYNKPEDFANMPLEELESLIKPCGFYKNKAKNIQNCSKQLIEKFNGEVPNSIDKLITLPGVGRKTANVVMAEAFKESAIAVDTHVLRVSNRIGFISSKDPLKVEQKLMKIIPKEKWIRAHHLLIFLGRYKCFARKPKCSSCKIKEYCKMGRNK